MFILVYPLKVLSCKNNKEIFFSLEFESIIGFRQAHRYPGWLFLVNKVLENNSNIDFFKVDMVVPIFILYVVYRR